MSAGGEARHVIVIGGGPVGLAAALALDRSGVRSCVLEARARPNLTDDPRVLALSHGTRLVLERLGAWAHVDAFTKIERIDVTQRGGLGRVELTAAEAGLPALGYVVSYASLMLALCRCCEARGVEILADTRVVKVTECDARVELEAEHSGVTRPFVAEVVVQADGAAPWLEDARTLTREYGQWAMVADVACERASKATAYERFTSEGPIALLPRAAQWSLIWTVPRAHADALLQAPREEFASRLSDCFGERVGRFTLASAVTGFPLALRFARDFVGRRIVLIGNAAQSLHPVAAQGFNLGIRDAYELGRALARPAAPQAALAQYRRERRLDRAGGAFFTDLLVRTFGAGIPLLGAVRGLGLAALDACPPAKRFFLRRMIFGVRG